MRWRDAQCFAVRIEVKAISINELKLPLSQVTDSQAPH